MKKIHFILFFGLLTFTSFSQKNKQYTSYIGVNVQPSHYWLYNKDEFTADTILNTNNDSIIINSLSYGLTYGHFFQKNFGFEIKLLFSNQTQYFLRIVKISDDVTDIWDCHTNLKYVKLPLNIINRKEIFPNGFLVAEYGLNLSYLTGATDYLYRKNELFNYSYIYRNNYIEGSGFSPEKNKKYFFDWKYKRFIFGGNIFLGYEHIFNSKISLELGIYSDFDFTNIDNTGALNYIYETDENGNIIRNANQTNLPSWTQYRYFSVSALQYDRKPSHNIHLGLEFGFKYWFGEKTLILKRKVPREW